MTTYGHESISLERHWQMMGALEALNGMLLFGLTTAFLFAMIQEVWQGHRRRQFGNKNVMVAWRDLYLCRPWAGSRP
jgi:hypothetical protein